MNASRVLLTALSAAAPLVLATAVSAADLPVRKTEPAYLAPAAPLYNWTGFYVGLNAGAIGANVKARNFGWADPTGANITAASPALPSLIGGSTGFLGGAQLGYNYQTGAFVVGAETDIQGAGLSKKASSAGPFALYGGGYDPVGTLASARNRLTWLGTTRLRAGLLVSPQLLVYATGGLAYGGSKLSYAYTGSANGYADTFLSSKSKSNAGWTLGGGVEYALTPNWTVKTEALYYDLGSKRLTLTDAAGYVATSDKVRNDGWLARVGVNYKF